GSVDFHDTLSERVKHQSAPDQRHRHPVAWPKIHQRIQAYRVSGSDASLPALSHHRHNKRGLGPCKDLAHTRMGARPKTAVSIAWQTVLHLGGPAEWIEALRVDEESGVMMHVVYIHQNESAGTDAESA